MTEIGKQGMQDIDKGNLLIRYCNNAFKSDNQQVVKHSALLLFNYLLCYRGESKKDI